MRAPEALALATALRARSERDRRELFTLERVGAFVRAIHAGVRPHLVLHAPPLLQSPVAQMQLRRLARDGIPVVRVSPERFRAVKTATRASGVLAVVPQRWVPLSDADPEAGLVWVGVERLRSPGNLGTILRTVEAVGGSGLICIGYKLDPYDPGVVRSSLGAPALLPAVRTTASELCTWARRHSVTLVGADGGGSERFDAFAWPLRTVLLLGDERKGLSGRVRACCGPTVRLPIAGRADSLNVAVAAGVLLYSAWSARELAPSPSGRMSEP